MRLSKLMLTPIQLNASQTTIDGLKTAINTCGVIDVFGEFPFLKDAPFLVVLIDKTKDGCDFYAILKNKRSIKRIEASWSRRLTQMLASKVRLVVL